MQLVPGHDAYIYALKMLGGGGSGKAVSVLAVPLQLAWKLTGSIVLSVPRMSCVSESEAGPSGKASVNTEIESFF